MVFYYSNGKRNKDWTQERWGALEGECPEPGLSSYPCPDIQTVLWFLTSYSRVNQRKNAGDICTAP